MTDAELIARLRDLGFNLTDAAADRIEALTEQLAAAQDDAKEAEAYAEELERERDDYALKLMRAINTYTEMHLDIERLSDKLATCEKYRDAYAECDRIGTQAVRGLEAKLAKTVELALEECPFRAGTPKYDKWWHHRRTTLAEIKGESHE
jgi:chromosome segregation ATPase